MAPLTVPSASQQTTQPLRRATYVHVSDLISAYNIDHAQLEKEIGRVNAKRSKLHMNVSSVHLAANATRGEKGEIRTEELFGAAKNHYCSDDSSGGVSAPEEDTDLESTIGSVAPQKRLQPPRGGFNLCVLVGRINLVVDKKRVDQSRVRLAEVEIGDETGTVSLRARDEQIDLLERVHSRGKPGAVVLRNCTLELYQGKHIRLAVTKWGKLAEYPDNVSSTPPPPSTMNHDRNFSLIDLSVVASEIAEKPASEASPYASSASATATTTASSSGRQTKKSDPETRTSRSSSSPKTSSSSSKQRKSGTKHHQQTSRKGNRSSLSEQRRHGRGSQYGGLKMDTSQPSRSDPMMYRGIQGYHTYGEQAADMRMQQQYPPHAAYAHHSHTHTQPQRHQDAASAQFALHQQYEMQQRQLHHLYSRDQNRQVGQVQHQHQAPPQQTSPMLVGLESSFDTSEMGNSPILVPPPEHYSQLQKLEGHSRMQQEPSHGTAPHSPAAYPPLGAMSGYRIGKMNPEATSFAPTYLSAAQGTSSQQHMPYPPQFSPYNLSQQQQQQPFLGAAIYSLPQSGHHPSLLVPSGVGSAHHHAISQATGFDAPREQHQHHDAEVNAPPITAVSAGQGSHHRPHYPPAATAPNTKESKSLSGKENITSK